MKLLKSNISTLYLLLAAWLFISLLAALEALTIHFFRPDAIQVPGFYYIPLIRLIIGFLAISMVLWPGYRFLKKQRILYQWIGYLLLMVLFVLAYTAFNVLLFQLFYFSLSWEYFIAGMGENLMSSLHHIAAYYFLLLFISIGRDYFKERTEALIKKEQAETELNRNKLIVLQRQIQPHFLFNTLNNTISIMDERTDIAQEMLVDLSDLLRTSIEMDFSRLIPLKHELEILSKYTSIEKKRFEHQLYVETAVDQEALAVKVPPFLLQPLVENAIKHGFKGSRTHLRIFITAKQESDQLRIEVKNDGAALKIAEGGIGIANVQKRLMNLYEGRAEFRLFQSEEFVVNELKLPLS